MWFGHFDNVTVGLSRIRDASEKVDDVSEM